MLKVAADKCKTCVYKLKYDKTTRDRLRQSCEATGGFIACHNHKGSDTVCRGYYDQHYKKQTGCTALQLARRFELMDGNPMVEFMENKSK